MAEREILSQPTASQAKTAANKYKSHPKIREWDKIKAKEMRHVVEEHAIQDQSFATCLLSTYPHKLTYNIPDEFWGSNFSGYYYGRFRSLTNSKDVFATILMEVRYHMALKNGMAAMELPSLVIPTLNTYLKFQ